MADSPKITHFSSFEELIAAIEADKTTTNITARRYPIRPILIDSFESFRRLVKELSLNHNTSTFNIEDLLEDDDFWITSDVLVDKILSIKEDTIISPFSEIVRFYPEEKFNSFFHTIMVQKENESNNLSCRIYLPLIGVDVRFTRFMECISREIGPVWELDEEEAQPIDITLVPAEFSVPENISCIRNTREWLQFWQKEEAGNAICCSRPLNLFYKYSVPDKIFSISQVENAYKVIKRFYCDALEIEYNPIDDEYWNLLLKELHKRGLKTLDFRKITCDILNLQRISIGDNFLPTWKSLSSDFHRWLLAKYFITYKSLKFPYLKYVVEHLESYDSVSLIAHVFNDIFDVDNYEELFEERNTYIRSLDLVKIGQENEDILKKRLEDEAVANFAKARDICGSTFMFERELILQWYAEDKISIDWVRNKYPAAYAYFATYPFENQKLSHSWVDGYMKSYKEAKLKDVRNETLESYIKKYNNDEQSFFSWYEDFDKTSDLRIKAGDFDHVYWVDALGIEWMSLIQHFVEENPSKMRIEHAYIAATGLPTSTQHNSKDCDTKISDLDEMVHGEYYQKYHTLAKQITLIGEIVDDLCRQKADRRILIISDHGLTALSRLYQPKKYEKKASHEGRYILLDKPCEVADNDYLRYHSDATDFIIALKHNSLNNKPAREVHGGCTPEEVFVPFIILSNRQDDNKGYTVEICKSELDIADPTISFIIDDLDDTIVPKIKYNGIISSLEYSKGSWNARLKSVSAGAIHIDLLLGSFTEEYNITIKSGIDEEDLFD